MGSNITNRVFTQHGRCGALLASDPSRVCARRTHADRVHSDSRGIWTDDECAKDVPCADPVQHPPHYTRGRIEVWDFIADQQLGFLEGNIIKYVCRHKHKGNPKQDLEKAKAYLEKLIASL
jgi:hypothetical protein